MNIKEELLNSCELGINVNKDINNTKKEKTSLIKADNTTHLEEIYFKKSGKNSSKSSTNLRKQILTKNRIFLANLLLNNKLGLTSDKKNINFLYQSENEKEKKQIQKPNKILSLLNLSNNSNEVPEINDTYFFNANNITDNKDFDQESTSSKMKTSDSDSNSESGLSSDEGSSDLSSDGSSGLSSSSGSSSGK